MKTPLVKKIGIFSHRHIGDALFSEPIVHFLKQKNYEVTLFVFSPINVELASFFRLPPNQVIVLNFNLLQDIKKVKEQVLDVAILLNHSLHVALISFLARVPLRYGRAYEGRSLLLTKTFKHLSKNPVHAFSLYMKSLHLFTEKMNMEKVEPTTNYPQLQIAQEKPSKDYILFQVGATRESKKIPLETYHQWINECKIKFPKLDIILCGDDKTNGELIEGADYNYIGKTSFREYVKLIKNAQYLLSPDTSAIHIGSALGIRVIGFYGSTNPNHYGPLSHNKHISLFLKKECSPCYKEFCPLFGDQFMQCLKNIDPKPHLKEIVHQ